MNRIRFTAINERNELVGQSEWAGEFTSADAPALLAHFRAQVGDNHRYLIERTGDSKVPNKPKLYRYRIAVDDSIYYSRLIQEREKDEALAQIKVEFPEAEITEEAA